MELTKYIGKPYKNYNCFDLIKEFYKDQYGIDLSNYWEVSDVPNKQTVERLINSSVGTFEQVSGEPRVGDLVIMKFHNIECHMGVYIGEGKFLHALKTCDSSIDRIARYRHLVSRYLRHTEVRND